MNRAFLCVDDDASLCLRCALFGVGLCVRLYVSIGVGRDVVGLEVSIGVGFGVDGTVVTYVGADVDLKVVVGSDVLT